MSWLHIRVIDPLQHCEATLVSDAEVFINSGSLTSVLRRQDGTLQIEMQTGPLIAELLMEYGALPYVALRP